MEERKHSDNIMSNHGLKKYIGEHKPSSLEEEQKILTQTSSDEN
jgi:hypothetical protein